MNDIIDMYLLGTVFDMIFIMIFIFIYVLYKNVTTNISDKIKISLLVVAIIFLSWLSFIVMTILVCLYILKKVLVL